jgi:hypothetical protein
MLSIDLISESIEFFCLVCSICRNQHNWGVVLNVSTVS